MRIYLPVWPLTVVLDPFKHRFAAVAVVLALRDLASKR